MYRGNRISPASPVGHPGCTRCGMPYTGRAEWLDGLCPSCTAEPPEKYVSYTSGGRKMLCRPWMGEFDDQDRPIDDEGQLVRPGERSCGHSDCVSASHVRVLELAA